MRLGIGSAAAPDASLGELIEAASRRGLAALELEEGHGHGLDPNCVGTAEVDDAAARAARAGVVIAGFRLAPPLPGSDPAGIAGLAAFATALGAPLLVPLAPGDEDGAGAADPSPDVHSSGLELVRALRGAGHRPAPVLPARRPLEWLDRVEHAVPGLPLAWDADPAAPDLVGTGRALLDRCGPRLRHLRLPGAGPEAFEQAGRGIGELMTRLALSRCDATLALVPSCARYRVIWDAWLGRRGGWGCGGGRTNGAPVGLAPSTRLRGAGSGRG